MKKRTHPPVVEKAPVLRSTGMNDLDGVILSACYDRSPKDGRGFVTWRPSGRDMLGNAGLPVNASLIRLLGADLRVVVSGCRSSDGDGS